MWGREPEPDPAAEQQCRDHAEVPEPDTRTEAQKKVDQESVSQFKGLNFGIGVGLSVDVGDEKRVQRVESIADTVRILEQKTSLPRVFLESHYFFMNDSGRRVWGHGPFVALVTGGEDLIDAIGGGWMVGWRRARITRQSAEPNETDKVETQSFNFAAGVLLDSKAQVLRDGVQANAPVATSQSLTKETSQWAVMFLFSFGF